MKKKGTTSILSVFLALVLVGGTVIPRVMAAPVFAQPLPIPTVDTTIPSVDPSLFMIDERIKNATPHWALLAADKEGQENALNDLKECSLSSDEVTRLSEGLRKIWSKYPTTIVQSDKGQTLTFASPQEGILTDEENALLTQADEILENYLNETIGGGNTMLWWGNPCHQDIIEISCLKWGVSSTYATYAHNAADDPDSWPMIWPPTGYEWLNNFIQQVCHSYDHYYNPELGTGLAPAQCANYANSAKSYYDQSSMYNAYTYMGYSSHFLTDVGNPLHTGMEIEQALNRWVHDDYENYVGTNWEAGSGQGYNFKSVINNNWYYYAMSNPATSTRSLASYAKNYDDTLFYLVYNHRYTFRTDPSVRSITQSCLLDTAKHSLGLVKYVRD